MKKMIQTVALLALVMATMSFAISANDTTILGQNYAKITSCNDFNQLRTWTNSGEVVNAIVMNDINCDGSNFIPIGNSEAKAYQGIFDGNGKTISGMNFQKSNDYAGMFGVIGTTGQVKNLTIASSKNSGNGVQYAGILVGLNYGLVTNVTVEATCSVNSSGSDVGGIAGRNGGYGTMSGCVNKANVTGSSDVGGIAGACTGAISSSVNYGRITGNKNVGGVVGSIHYRTSKTLESGRDSTFVPGRVALCQNVGEVVGGTYAGGIAGENKTGVIDNCRNDGNVSANSSNGTAGGVVGYTYFEDDNRYKDGNYKPTVSNSFNTASVTGKTIGGVAGKIKNPCKTKNWYNGSEEYYTYASITNSYYDIKKLANVSAVATNSNGVVTQVSGKQTSDMHHNDAFVVQLNSGSSYIAWLYDSNDYPVLNLGADAGNFKVTFIVDGKTYYEATTVNNKMVGAVSNPQKTSGIFKGWLDDGKLFSSNEANERTYTRSVVYTAVLNELFEITFVTSYGVELGRKQFEKGSPIFYSETDENGLSVEKNPDDLDADTATFVFEKWDRDFGVATQNETYTAIFKENMKVFTVSFFVFAEEVYNQKVDYGQPATAPADPEFEGFRFDGWNWGDADPQSITSNLEVHAIMTAMSNICTVYANETNCYSIPSDDDYTIPNFPESDSLTCTVWKDNDGTTYKPGEVVKASQIKETLTAECEVNMFDVKFMAKEEEVERQSVAYGESAVAPAEEKIPEFPGFRFSNWIEDFSVIKVATIVNAKYVETVKVCFGAGEFDAESCETLDKDSTYDIPELPGIPGDEGFTCTEWTLNDKTFEGTTFVANADMNFVANCHKNTFDVKFFVKNKLHDEQRVAFEDPATAPADPVVDGYRFDGWDKDFSKITEDLDVNANMTEVVEVCFGISCSIVPVDTTIIVPELPSTESTTCSDWEYNDVAVEAGVELVVKANMNFTTECDVNTYTVKFIVLGETKKTETVKHGKPATAPVDPEVKGYRFDGWDVPFGNITADLDVNAILTAMTEVCFEVADTTFQCVEVPSDTIITEENLPELPQSDSLTCVAWLNGDVEFTRAKASDIEKLEAQCSVNEFNVKFIVLNDTIKTETVEYGKPATAPADPVVDGHRFEGWDVPFGNITADLNVNAILTAMTEVCFEVADTTFQCVEVPSDTIITEENLPELPQSDSLTCVAWLNGDVEFTGAKASDIEKLEAQCSVNEFNVKFIVLNDTIKTETVEYGKSATAPADPVVDGYRFENWDKDFSNITADLNVNAILTAMTEVCFEVADTTFQCVKVPSDTIITEENLPELPQSDSLTCVAWLNGDVEFTRAKASDIEKLEAQCSVNEFNVKFFVQNDLYNEQKVAFNDSAKTPKNPVVDGYRFENWDKDFSKITADLNVNAILTAMTEVCKEYAGKTTCETVPSDTVIVLPDFPESDSLTCTVWKDDANTYNVGESVFVSKISGTLTAVCEVNKFNVKFVAFDTLTVDSQMVAYGEAAVEPADSLVPQFEGYRFRDWDADFTYITSGLVVNAMYDTLVKINISAKIGLLKKDSTMYVMKDTVISDIDSVRNKIDSLAGMAGVKCKIYIDDAEFNDDTLMVSKDIDVDVKCVSKKYVVSFYFGDSLLTKETVFHGFSANYIAPEFENKRFVSWDVDVKKVMSDLDAHAIYVDIDSILVMVNDNPFDTIVVAKDDSVQYVLKSVDNTEDSTFLSWVVDGKNYEVGDTVFVKFGSEIYASFEETNAIHAKRLAVGFNVRSENSQIMISGARIGDVMAILDLQGRVILKKRVQNSVEMVNIASRGSYLVRVGAQTKRVIVR